MVLINHKDEMRFHEGVGSNYDRIIAFVSALVMKATFSRVVHPILKLRHSISSALEVKRAATENMLAEPIGKYDKFRNTSSFIWIQKYL